MNRHGKSQVAKLYAELCNCRAFDMEPGEYTARIKEVEYDHQGSLRIALDNLAEATNSAEEALQKCADAFGQASVDMPRVVLHPGALEQLKAQGLYDMLPDNLLIIDEMPQLDASHFADAFLPSPIQESRHGFNFKCEPNYNDLEGYNRHVKPFYRKGRW